MSNNIESVLHEHRSFPPSRETVANANVKPADFEELCGRVAQFCPGCQ